MRAAGWLFKRVWRVLGVVLTLFLWEQVHRALRCHGVMTSCFFNDKASNVLENVIYSIYTLILLGTVLVHLAAYREIKNANH